MLAAYSAKPVEGCLEAVKKACRYAAGCLDECLMATASFEGLWIATDSD